MEIQIGKPKRTHLAFDINLLSARNLGLVNDFNLMREVQ